jgi:hypothetical protein
MKEPYDYFPGDPPIAEMTLALSAIIAAALLLVLVFRLVLARLRNRPVRFSRLGLFLAMALPLFAALPIARRHFTPMSALKRKLLELEEEHRTLRSQNPDLTEEELLDALAARSPNGWTVSLSPEYPPMAITLTGFLPGPQFKVHFGHGGDAIFDPQTMWVLYSD